MLIFLLILLIGAAFFVYAWFVEPSFLTISRHGVSVPSTLLSEPVRLLFVSDFHLSRFNEGRNLRRSLQRLAELHRQEPFDAVLFGGDYLDRDAAYAPTFLKIVAGYRRLGLPMYAVYGNHDHRAYADIRTLGALLEGQGVTVLRNACSLLEVRGQTVGIIGLEDLEESPVYQPVKRTLSPAEYLKLAPDVAWLRDVDRLPEGMARIVLCHNPDAALLPARIEPSLVVSGHTHGGQILPLRYIGRFIYAFMPPGSFCTWSGSRTVHGRRLIVGRGLEGSAVPLRFLCPPEALVITLEPSTSR